MVRTLPGAHLAQRQIERAEARILAELKHRLDHLETADTDRGAASALPARAARLIERAQAQTPEQAADELFHALLNQLVADEMLILQTLAKEGAVPMLHAAIGPRLGPATQRLASSLGTLGKLAGIKLPSHLPGYIERLRALGLVEAGAEDAAFEVKYQMLQADPAIRAAVEQAKPGPLSGVHYQRRVLRLSSLGQAFWQACAGAPSPREVQSS
ncbi:Abi-alpha family protein [Sinimarinibacterium thermocellulolyticum]|uniref:Abi-alpha family protein n=1 Tax=Sinimarinibacterium thermocellulolyticum TaxID=3170016 RepID=A0ABV2A818_9GAMM